MSKQILIAFGIVGSLLSPSVATADFRDLFTGNSQFSVGDDRGDGVVNFAVYQNPGGVWTDDFSVTFQHLQQNPLLPANQSVGDAVDTMAAYVYFYQVVNTNPVITGESALNGLLVDLPFGTDTVTSAGYIADRVFNDPTDGLDLDTNPDGATGPAGNARLGLLPDTTPPPDDFPDGILPSERGTVDLDAGTAFVSAPSNPIEPLSATELDGMSVRFAFPPIPAGDFSSIFFLTSNFAPTYGTVILEDGADTQADIPVPTPELGTFAMTFGALVCGLAAVVASRRKAMQVE